MRENFHPDLEFRKVTSPNNVTDVVRLAQIIWRAHYTPIIGTTQVEYMLSLFQSEKVIAEQIQKGYEYYTVRSKDKLTVYFAIAPDLQTHSVILSKIYILPEHQGRGIGKAVINFVKHRSDTLDCQTVRLTVNRNNSSSIAFYKKVGFMVEYEKSTDIGNGFVTDDFIMVYKPGSVNFSKRQENHA
ncbi:MAG: GNAT family N-acetyltransferase [Lentisphaerae bacterium]|nr:GNAT family N-acetyltransferase [Lentisphaerota bacterium]